MCAKQNGEKSRISQFVIAMRTVSVCAWSVFLVFPVLGVGQLHNFDTDGCCRCWLIGLLALVGRRSDWGLQNGGKWIFLARGLRFESPLRSIVYLFTFKSTNTPLSQAAVSIGVMAFAMFISRLFVLVLALSLAFRLVRNCPFSTECPSLGRDSCTRWGCRDSCSLFAP